MLSHLCNMAQGSAGVTRSARRGRKHSGRPAADPPLEGNRERVLRIRSRVDSGMERGLPPCPSSARTLLDGLPPPLPVHGINEGSTKDNHHPGRSHGSEGRRARKRGVDTTRVRREPGRRRNSCSAATSGSRPTDLRARRCRSLSRIAASDRSVWGDRASAIERRVSSARSLSAGCRSLMTGIAADRRQRGEVYFGERLPGLIQGGDGLEVRSFA